MRKIVIGTRLIIEGFVNLLILPIIYLPGFVGDKLRYLYYKPKLKYLGNNVKIDVGVHIIHPECISIDDNCWIDKYVILLAGCPFEGKRKIYEKENINYHEKKGELKISKNVHIAPYVLISALGGVQIGNNLTIASGSKIYSFSHHYKNLLNIEDDFIYKFTSMAPPEEQALISSPIVIEDNTAIGVNTVVLPGVTIHQNSWIGANSVVISDIPPNVIAVGNPAKPIKDRFTQKKE